MTDRKSLVIESGTTKQIPDSDVLVVGVGIKVATGTTLTIGAVGDTIAVPGDLDVTGNVNSIGSTTFTDNATFNGDVTFGDATAPDSSVTFAASTTIDSNMDFGLVGGNPAYKITNLADGVNPSDAATVGQLSSGAVSSFSGGSTGLTPASATTGAVTLGGTLGVDSGGTGSNLSSLASGSMIYADSATTMTSFPIGSFGYFLKSNGSLPTWDQIQFTDVTGTLAVNQGGTGVTSLSANGALVMDSFGTQVESKLGVTSGDVLTWDGTTWAAAAPADVNVGNTYVAIGDGTGITGSAALAFSAGVLSSDAALTIEAGGTGDITIDSASAGGLLTLTGANVTAQASSNGSITLAPGNNGAVYIGVGGADADVIVGSAGPANALFVQGSDGFVGINTGAPSAQFSIAEKLLIDGDGRITKYDDAAVAKGDLLAGSAASGFVAVGVGTDGQVLQADSAATGGVSWYTIPAGTDYSVVALTTAQAANTAVTVAGAAAIATSESAARVAGIVAAANSVKVLGIVTCIVEAARAGEISAGEPVYLSASEAGKVTDVAPSTATQVVAELGIATDVDSSGTVTVLWQPKSIVVL